MNLYIFEKYFPALLIITHLILLTITIITFIIHVFYIWFGDSESTVSVWNSKILLAGGLKSCKEVG